MGVIDDATYRALDEELERAACLHPTVPKIERCFVVLGEEVGEACKEVLSMTRTDWEAVQKIHAKNARAELLQVAATALRMADKLLGGPCE